MEDLQITARGAAVRVQVRVKPRASRSAILESVQGVLTVALAAPPVDGEANAELIRFLASVTGLPKSAVVIASGGASRTKLLDFSGIDSVTLRDLLRAASRKPARK